MLRLHNSRKKSNEDLVRNHKSKLAEAVAEVTRDAMIHTHANSLAFGPNPTDQEIKELNYLILKDKRGIYLPQSHDGIAKTREYLNNAIHRFGAVKTQQELWGLPPLQPPAAAAAQAQAPHAHAAAAQQGQAAAQQGYADKRERPYSSGGKRRSRRSSKSKTRRFRGSRRSSKSKTRR